MMIFTLLMITISWTAAIPHENFLETNTNGDNLEIGSESLNRSKRESSVTLIGDHNDFTYYVPHSKLNLLGTITPNIKTYHRNTFNITHDLGYTSWNEFRAAYHTADLNGYAFVRFSLAEGENLVNEVVTVQPIDLQKIEILDTDITAYYGFKPGFYIATGPSTARKQDVLSAEDMPFDKYKQELYNKTVWKGVSRMNIKLFFTLEGYKKDGSLMLHMVFKTIRSNIFSVYGIDFMVSGYQRLDLS